MAESSTPRDEATQSRKRKRKIDDSKNKIKPAVKRKRSNTTASYTTCDEFAIDCEMTQIRRGPANNTEQVLASVAIVDSSMNVIYHAVCPPPGWDTTTCKSELIIPMSRPFCPITDKQFQKAALKGVTFECVQEKVKDILSGKNVIGHALQNDLNVLGLTFPKENVYDVQLHYTPKRCSELGLGSKGMPLRGPKFGLKTLAKYILEETIQNGPHDAKEDAKATMALYLYDKLNFKATGIPLVKKVTAVAQRERRKRRRRKKSLNKLLQILNHHKYKQD